MTPKRRTARQLTLLATMLAAAILLAAGPACAPAALGGQDSGQAEADATTEATVTATAATAATNTPTLEPSATAGTTSAAAPETTPTDLPSPEPPPTMPVTPDMAKLGMYTGAVVSFLSAPTPAAVVADDAVSGASGAGAPAPVIPPIALPPLIDASISTLDLEATRSFLEANGGAITESFQPRGAVNWAISADMPPALLPALSQQPETLHAFVGVLYEKVDNDIGEMVVEYGVKKANNPGIGLGSIVAIVEATPEGYANVRRLLARHNLRLTYPDDFGRRHGFQIIPAGLVLPISELPGVTYINRPPIAVPAVLPESQHRPARPVQCAGWVHGARRCAML